VDGDAVLQKIRGFAPTSWNYIGHDPKQFRHYGPMAQEFFAAFGHDAQGTIGSSTTINAGDIAGILMIGVQALEKRTGELRQENNLLKETVEAFKAENADLAVELGQEKARLTETVEAVKAELKAQRQHREIEQREQAAQIGELQAQLVAVAGRLKRLDRQDLTGAASAGRPPTP
jgi:regulator of replication initiation timing